MILNICNRHPTFIPLNYILLTNDLKINIFIWRLMVINNFEFYPQIPTVTTESGLQYKDIKVGSGPSPPVGYQVR